MRRVVLAALALCFLPGVILFQARSAQVSAPEPFSADMTSTLSSAKATTVITGKIYSSAPKTRQDRSINGGETITSIFTDGKLSYVLYPAQHSYSQIRPENESPELQKLLDEKLVDPDHPCGPSMSPCINVGTEMVDGRLCEKWLFTIKGNTLTTWFDRRLSFPIKKADTSGFTWHLTNIVEGKQEASLFEVPADYKKLAAFGGVAFGSNNPAH